MFRCTTSKETLVLKDDKFVGVGVAAQNCRLATRWVPRQNNNLSRLSVSDTSGAAAGANGVAGAGGRRDIQTKEAVKY